MNGLLDWLAGLGYQPPFALHALPGGNSNVTLVVTDASGARLVVRRPPGGTALATAHDVLREARILTALHRGGVPVPEVLATCEDCAVIGVPFVVMRFVEGLSCYDATQARSLPDAARDASGYHLARTLAGLHRLDADAVGLGQLGPRGDYLQRQLRRWRRQVDTDRRRETPGIDQAHAILLDAAPQQQRVSVVHGDVRLDNCILSPTGEIRALVDWEICALGDPLADLGLLLAYWAQPSDRVRVLHDPPTAVPGFATRAQLADAYLSAAGLPVDTDVSYYVAFAWWKIACIVEGVWARAVRQNRELPRPLPSYAEQSARIAHHAFELAQRL